MFPAGMDPTAIPQNMKKLCEHLAKNDPDIADHLYRLSIKFISKTTTNRFAQENSISEQFVVSQIRKILGKNRLFEDVAKFDLIYTKLQKNTIIRNKSAILQFLFNLSMEEPITTIGMLDVPVIKSKQHSRVKLSSQNSGANIKKIQNVSSQKSFGSSNTHDSIQTIQSPSLMWTNSEANVSYQNMQLQVKDSKMTTTSSTTSFPPTYLTEGELMLDVIYSFQGIEGKFIKKDYASHSFYIDPRYSSSIGTVQKGLVERLLGMGFLYNTLKQFCEDPDKEMGIIGQSLISVVREELTEYFRLVATLQAQLKRQNCSEHSELTLRRMIVWVAGPQRKLEWLAYIVEQCQDKKGGALISAVHGFLQHGGANTRSITLRVLTAVCRPLYHMLAKWLLDGDLSDNYSEFFIEVRLISGSERMWHDKYIVRQNMIPSFISMEQASKILATGKNINFLRHICRDNEQQVGREALQKIFDTTNVEALFAPEQSIDFYTALNNFYRKTSSRVIELLKERYTLMEHFQAIKRFILLGQGDFVNKLLELLRPELEKSDKKVYPHILTAILDTAIRSTNAQYEDEERIKRLNVCILESSLGDVGWDIFSLVYSIDGPISTIFHPSIKVYKMLFGVLWLAKHAEFVLSNIRKQQITSGKIYRHVKELHPVLHRMHVLTSEMIHFLNQTLDYYLSEILECSWVEMFDKVNHAECLDDIISAHSVFLEKVQTGFYLKTDSTKLLGQLRLMMQVVMKLEALQNEFFFKIEKELPPKYNQPQPKIASKAGTHSKDKETKELKEFNHFLQFFMGKAKNLAASFKGFMNDYLKMLSTSTDVNLQLLSVRLNFNDYYKIM